MADQLIELFDVFVECMTKKNLNRMMKIFADDATFVVYAPPYKPLSGKREIRAFFESDLARFADYSAKTIFACEKGNIVVVEWVIHYKDTRVSKIFDQHGISIIEAKNGLIQNMREYVEVF